ncbi:MAG: DUF1501 domain-containing protein [Planctomycetia bacterium]|nr:DUF1501 domain-containing protein [Planctomycetia bacterium]
MRTPDEQSLIARRQFLTSTASGIGLLALASVLRDDGLLAAESTGKKGGASAAPGFDPLAMKAPHFAPRAQRCICIFLEGGPSQVDLFDPKPELNRLDGQRIPESLTKNVRFAFIQKDTATIMASPRKFGPHGQCGMELSDLLPHLSTCVDDIALLRSVYHDTFNHHPGQLLMNTGVPRFGRPTMGAWLNYGLGTECRDLPGYVVLNSGRGTSGGASNWSSGFLSSAYAGVVFRNQGDPILNLANPPGISAYLQGETIDAVDRLNRKRFDALGDAEINSRIAAYELAFRMQASAPELIDLSRETQETREAYGVDREDPNIKADRAGGPGQYRAFATNCLLARRLIERGVRFVNLYHASWDHHTNLNVELPFNAGMADQPIAALLKDLKQRGLLDETLVIWCSEFGRTPLGENREGRPRVTGRDHHPFAFSMWMAGGGVKGGQVVGKTDDIGWGIVEDPVHVDDFHATLLHLFGLDHLKLNVRKWRGGKMGLAPSINSASPFRPTLRLGACPTFPPVRRRPT